MSESVESVMAIGKCTDVFNEFMHKNNDIVPHSWHK